MHAPVVVLKDSTKRESGTKVHHANIRAAKAVAEVIRTTLGPRSMLKMLLDAAGGIVVTNDGNAILRELDLAHPAAKSMIELSRTQDEEVGDGTTSVIVLAGEMLHVAEDFIDKNFHPTVICRAYTKALEDAITVIDKVAMTIDVKDRATMLGLVKSCIGTKFTSQFGDLIADLAIEATTIVGVDLGQGLREVDIKKYIKVEKVPGGQLEDSQVLKGVMFNKDVVAPGKMRRKILNPRVILLDSPLEYKKGENQTNAEIMKDEDWEVLLKMEEEYIQNLCGQILLHKPDVVITEKGLSDLACHYLSKAGVTAIRRVRKTDNNRIAKACGAVIVNRPDELQESDVGTGAGLFEVKKIGDEFFTFIVDCKDPKACTVLLRGASKDLLNEVERNLQDAMCVARNIIKNPKLVPGGGATELTVSAALKQKSASIEGIEKWPYEAAALAFEAIPRTLAQNCGVNVIRTMTALRGKHANGENAWIGIDGNTGEIADMKEKKIWDSYSVKAQTFNKHEGYLLALALFFSKTLESLSQRQWYFKSRLIGLKVRSLLTAAIYKKQLLLSNAARMRHSAGEIMNYVTVDAYRIGEFPFWAHQTWTTSLQLCIALFILVHSVGLATLAALAVIILTVLCNTPLAKLQHKFQSKLMVAQDARLKAYSEALVNMKVLKLYAWETHFKNVIECLRKVEVKWLSAVQLRRSYNGFLFWSSPVLVSAATFGACYVLKIPLHASNVFTFVATLRLVQEPIRSIPDVISVVIQARVAFTRIVEFLLEPELLTQNVKKKSDMGNLDHAIKLRSANLSWEKNSSKPTLRNINLAVRPGEKVAICGEVGSGKSTLLAAILGEVPYIEGTVAVYGKIAYVSQTAWIQTGTIRENILFGSSMDELRYQETLRRCSLMKDLDLLPYGDRTEIGERGVNLSGGQKQRIQLARALYQDADIYLLDDPFSAVDAHTATSLFSEYIMEALSAKTVLLVTHQVDFLPAFHCCLLMSDGEILQSGSYHELLASSQEFLDLVNAHKETAGTEKLPEAGSSGEHNNPAKEIKRTIVKKQYEASEGDQLIKREEREEGDTGLKPYFTYLNQNKGYIYLSIAVICHLTFTTGQILQNTWMASSVDNPQVSTFKLIVVYLIIGASSTLFLLFRSLAVVAMGLAASKSLFSQLLSSLFHAPMSFYDSTPLGRILSRVSSDLGIVDLDVAFSLLFSIGATINAYANLGVLAVITWQVLFVSIPVIYLAIRLQKYYFATAKELMRMNGTTKSLVANHLAESIAGAITIRAFEEEDRFFAKSLDIIDINASPFFHNFTASEWLIQRLETLSATVLAAAALSMVLLPTGTFSSGFIGMALSYGLSLNMSLVNSIQNQCTLANYIICVERLDQYMHIPSEAPEVIEDSRPPENWPSAGKVEICNLQIRYRPDTPLVLKGISCTFEGGDKIGIVGRTGSGKTTLIGALFRLVEPVAGKIVVDGMDICSIGLHDLRSHFGIIPQDPTLFNGTVRFNLDPLCQHNDEELWEVLGKCQLKEVVQDKEQGLDSAVVEDGSNWSMGQRQLFCLGRALLRRSRVLVLDEATASIDNATDTILQRTIRTEFADCTVITVAHRIPTVMDCTKVLAISDGKLVEYDDPIKLMKKEDSLFAQLVKEYWSHFQSAEQAH